MFKITRLVIAIAALVLGSTTLSLAATSATPAKTVAQASPAPTATPNPFSYRGYVRAYDFTRQNAYNGHNANNQQSFNAALSLHGDYAFARGWTLGGSYLYANPLGNCTTAVSHLTPPCGNNAAPALNPDDTLPGFQLSTLYEAYLKYSGNGFKLAGGDLVGSLPWAPSSDSRLKPVAFQGVDATYQVNKQWAVQAADYWQWECRTCSNFDHGTLLTTTPAYPGAGNIAGNLFDPTHTALTNNGVFYGRVGYTGPKTMPLTANLSYYGFSNIANAWWLDGKYAFQGKLKPFVALQFGSENDTGSSLIGKIQSSVFGLQAGFNPMKNLALTAGVDIVPQRTDNVSAATMLALGGYSCDPVKHQIKNPAVGLGLNYALPGGGTAQCTTLANGSTDIYYGGWLSPYTDSYATDPFFTTSMIQGMVDRRSAGRSAKLQATFTSDDKRFVSFITQAWYDYSNAGYSTGTTETDFDTMYHFNKLPKKGAYKGFLARYRYGSREEAPSFYSGIPALFKYNRFQVEYDF